MGDQCTKCFQEYCWDGTLNTTANAYNPVLKSDNGTFAQTGQGNTSTSSTTSSTSGAGRSYEVSILGTILAAVLGIFLV